MGTLFSGVGVFGIVKCLPELLVAPLIPSLQYAPEASNAYTSKFITSMTIGELSRTASVPITTLRYWEAQTCFHCRTDTMESVRMILPTSSVSRSSNSHSELVVHLAMFASFCRQPMEDWMLRPPGKLSKPHALTHSRASSSKPPRSETSSMPERQAVVAQPPANAP